MKTNIKDKQHYIALTLIAALGLFAAIFMYKIIPNGPGVSDDSVSYLHNAQSLISGNGFSQTAHFPPAYPILLSIVNILQHDELLQSSRLVSAVLFGINTMLIGIAVFIVSNRSLLATALMIFSFLASARVIFIHSMALSEAMFITFMLTAFILLSFYIFQQKIIFIFGVSISIGIAMATRYVGLTLLPPMILGFLIVKKPIKLKIRDSFLLTFLASIPITAWLIRNLSTANTLTNRHLVIHLFKLPHIYELLGTLSDFVIPIERSNKMKALLIVVASIIFLFLCAYLYRKNYKWPNVRTLSGILTALLIMFFITYIAFLVISISFFDASIPLSPRILLPSFIAIVISIFSFANYLSKVLNKPIIWHGFLLVVFLLSVINSTSAFTTAKYIYDNGGFYNSNVWNNSQTIKILNQYENNLFIYSNGTEVIQFLTRRNASGLPLITDPRTLQTNPNFDNQLKDICKEVQNGQAIIVYLDELRKVRWFFPVPSIIEAKCDKMIINRFEDGTIYNGQ